MRVQGHKGVGVPALRPLPQIAGVLNGAGSLAALADGLVGGSMGGRR